MKKRKNVENLCDKSLNESSYDSKLGSFLIDLDELMQNEKEIRQQKIIVFLHNLLQEWFMTTQMSG